MSYKIKTLDVKRDHRGWLAEIIRPEDVYNKTFGQVLVTTASPGKVKGNHYHKRKTEWYCVISGKGLLSLRDNSTKKVVDIEVNGHDMKLIEIPPNHFHSIKNIGDKDMYLLAYVNEPFDPKDPDIFYE